MGIRIALCALAVAALAGCSTQTNSAPGQAMPRGASPTVSTTAAPPVAPPAAYGVEATLDTIPWSRVGPGWLLATWSPLAGHMPGNLPPNQPDPDTVKTALYLVDPQGGRYPITSFGPGRGSDFEVIDWSGDKSRALLRTNGVSGNYVEVDLHTGKQTPLPFSDSDDYPSYTLPDGKALLVTGGGYQKPKTLIRTDLTGKPQQTYPVGQDFQGALYTPDGTQLVIGTSNGLAFMGNDGAPGKAIPVEGQKDCGPIRWWDADAAVVLAGCGAHPSQLWLVPVDGTAPTALTAPNEGQDGPNFGDTNAWNTPAGTFMQELGACGVVYLATLNPDGSTTKVDVPDLDGGSTIVVGVNGGSLRLEGRAACGGGIALADWNPSTNVTTVLLGGPLNGGGVTSAVAFKGQR
jgi:hypothetical protein